MAALLACGLRRHESVNPDFGHIQQREDHRAIFDLKGIADALIEEVYMTPERKRVRELYREIARQPLFG